MIIGCGGFEGSVQMIEPHINPRSWVSQPQE
jgi:hypothetical protein